MPMRPPIFRPRKPSVTLEVAHVTERKSARERGYDATWDKASRAFRRANPMCVGCKAVGRFVASEVTDHIIPHRGDLRLFWDRGNWQASCRWHHDNVKQLLERDYEQGKASAEDLRLTGAAAMALTRRLIGMGEGGG